MVSSFRQSSNQVCVCSLGVVCVRLSTQPPRTDLLPRGMCNDARHRGPPLLLPRIVSRFCLMVRLQREHVNVEC
jgi:hypothetical protein